MPSLKEVRARIVSIISTQQITKAMKMVSAAKLRRAQDRIVQFRPFSQKLSDIIRHLSGLQDGDGVDNWFGKEREVKHVLLVAVNSDRGLCGSFNSNIHKAVLRLIQEKYPASQGIAVTILPLGRKALDFFTKRRATVVPDYWSIFKELSFDDAAAVADHIMEGFRTGTYDRVELVYNEFRNVATQVLRTEQFLPVAPVETVEHTPVDYIFQPDRAGLMAGIIPKSLRAQLFKAVLDSNAAEHGARMTAMDKATDNAGELLKELRLTFNRTRQAAITKEILEIVGGAEALRAS